MHYCQRCPEPVMMLPDPPKARCPVCGATEQARQAALYVVTGASGSGKTTVLPHLVDALPESAVFDVDWLIDPVGRCARTGNWIGRTSGTPGSRWLTGWPSPVERRYCSDRSTPSSWIPCRPVVGSDRFAMPCWTAQTGPRRARLEERPPWRERQIEEHINFAAYLHEHADLVVSTEHRSPSGVAADLASWVRTHRPDDRQPVRRVGVGRRGF